MDDAQAQGLLSMQQEKRNRIRDGRLFKEYSQLSQLKCQYEIRGSEIIVRGQESPLRRNLYLRTPEDYPFSAPQYRLSGSQQYNSIVEILPEWVPKLKIIQVIQLIIRRVQEREKTLETLKSQWLYQLVKSVPSTWFVVSLGITLRVLVGIGSYSGYHDPPSYGDFEAHRNWMSITLNRPINLWYSPGSLNTITGEPWWRIDYPPVAAYLSYLFAQLYRLIQPASMAIQQGYESQSLKSYMRFTALLTEMSLLLPAILLYHRYRNEESNIRKTITSVTVFLALLRPDLILIDHGHFQYNSLILGLILMAFYCLSTGRYYLTCLLYTVAIHSKQMAVYYSLAFFAGLLGINYRKYRHRLSYALVECCKYALIVIVVSVLIYLPWLGSDFSAVLSALFPIQRGLYQLKVGNFWCISNTLIKWEEHFSKPALMALCGFSCVVFSMPSMVGLIVSPCKKVLSVGFLTISLTFFMFSYHVHEKSILLPLLFTPVIQGYCKAWRHLMQDFVIAGCVGMFHLLQEDGQQLGYISLIAIFWCVSAAYNTMMSSIEEESLSRVEKMHDSVYNTRIRSGLFALGLLGLHLAEKLVEPSAKFPYLHNLTFAFYSFLINAYTLVLGNAYLLEQIYETFGDKRSKAN